MTERGRYSDSASRPARKQPATVRITGSPGEITQIIGRLAHVVDILRQSRQIPRQNEPGSVMVYLQVAADVDA